VCLWCREESARKRELAGEREKERDRQRESKREVESVGVGVPHTRWMEKEFVKI